MNPKLKTLIEQEFSVPKLSDYLKNFFNGDISKENLKRIYDEEINEMKYENGFQIAYSAYANYSAIYAEYYKPSQGVVVTHAFFQAGLKYICDRFSYNKIDFKQNKNPKAVRHFLYTSTLLGYVTYLLFLIDQKQKLIKNEGMYYPEWSHLIEKDNSRNIQETWLSEEEQISLAKDLSNILGFNPRSLYFFILRYRMWIKNYIGDFYKTKTFFSMRKKDFTNMNAQFVESLEKQSNLLFEASDVYKYIDLITARENFNWIFPEIQPVISYKEDVVISLHTMKRSSWTALNAYVSGSSMFYMLTKNYRKTKEKVGVLFSQYLVNAINDFLKTKFHNIEIEYAQKNWDSNYNINKSLGDIDLYINYQGLSLCIESKFISATINPFSYHRTLKSIEEKQLKWSNRVDGIKNSDNINDQLHFFVSNKNTPIFIKGEDLVYKSILDFKDFINELVPNKK